MSTPPATLGQYEILREIARSNDIVYEAYDPLMNRRVAVKELVMPAGATDAQREERLNRFKREAQAAGTLNHPNIMTVYSYAEDDGRAFMAMEFLDGHTLRNEIDTKGVSQDRAVEIAMAVLDGLAHAHQKGVVHRDIKPENIQILSNGGIKITDFGIARLTFQPNLTMDGQVFGTPSYMSPEQIIGRDIDARSDLFSVGILLYEMIANQKPFTGDHVMVITHAIMNAQPAQPTGMSQRVWQVVQRALEKSPDLRYATASEMRIALDEAFHTASDPNFGQMPFGQANYGSYGTPAPPPVGGGLYPPGMAPPGMVPPGMASPGYGTPTAGGYTQAPYAGPYGGSLPGAPVPGNTYPPAYGAPSGNPYLNPNPGSVYNYNAQPAYTPPPMVGMPPPGPLPQYYPPKPRDPIFRPEQVDFMKRVFWTVVILGTLFWLLTMVFQAIAIRIQSNQRSQELSRIASAALDPNSTQPIANRIEAVRQYRNQITDPALKDAVGEQLAVLYQKQGLELVREQQYPHAEQSMLSSIELDEDNPDYHASLASAYEQRALSLPDSETRANLLYQAGRSWARSADLTLDSVRQRERRRHAASLLLNYGRWASNNRQSERVVEASQSLRSIAPSLEREPDILGQIRNFLSSVE